MPLSTRPITVMPPTQLTIPEHTRHRVTLPPDPTPMVPHFPPLTHVPPAFPSTPRRGWSEHRSAPRDTPDSPRGSQSRERIPATLTARRAGARSTGKGFAAPPAGRHDLCLTVNECWPSGQLFKGLPETLARKTSYTLPEATNLQTPSSCPHSVSGWRRPQLVQVWGLICGRHRTARRFITDGRSPKRRASCASTGQMNQLSRTSTEEGLPGWTPRVHSAGWA